LQEFVDRENAVDQTMRQEKSWKKEAWEIHTRGAKRVPSD
jgi:hypothetical protein